MTVFIPPAHILDVLRQLTGNGHAAFLVGGGVRDSFLKRPVHDWDITTSARTEEIAELFEKTVMTGAKYGTVTVILPECSVEITTFRTDGEYRDGRRPESVSFTAGLEDDLKRRDFTMNAIAMSENGEIIDPHGGRADLKKGIIRCVGEPVTRFREDGLRMLRAMRFSAELGFQIESDTMAAIRKLAPESAKLSAERVRDEFSKVLISKKPETAGDMVRYGLLSGRVNSTNGDFTALTRLGSLPPENLLRRYAFCAVLRRAGLISSVTAFTRGLRQDGKTVRISDTAEKIMLSVFPDDNAGIKRLLAQYGTEAVRCAAAADTVLNAADALVRTDEVINSGECFSLSQLAVTGRDLIKCGFEQNAELGKILNVLLLHVIAHPQDNSQEFLTRYAKNLV